VKISVELEPVLCTGHHGDKTYYAFAVVGMVNEWGGPLMLASSAASYPGNDVVRKFINEHGVQNEHRLETTA
jgi:hypothetical protein